MPHAIRQIAKSGKNHNPDTCIVVIMLQISTCGVLFAFIPQNRFIILQVRWMIHTVTLIEGLCHCVWAILYMILILMLAL
jgi:hypothetical protein